MSYQRDYERRLRVGLVGTGGHAYRNILPVLHFLPVELVALCDTNAALVARTANEYGVRAVYTEALRMYAEEDLDAVLLCVGAAEHPPLAIEALQAGLHVWMEKPPALRVGDVLALIDAQGDTVCAVGFKKAYMPAIRKAVELTTLPEFGQLRSILATYPVTIPADGPAVLERGRLTNWLANGCHPISAMLALGGPVDAVTALLGPGEECVGVVFLEFASGAVGTLYLAGGAPAGCPVERYQLFGDGRAIDVDDAVRVTYRRGIPFDYGRQRDFFAPGVDSGSVVWEVTHALATLENKALFVQGFFNELLDFCEAALTGRPLRTADLAFALQVMRVYEAALRSGRERVVL